MSRPYGALAALAAALLAAWPLGEGTARAAVAHTVQPGETLWSIAAAQNLTTRTVAVYNGVSETATVVAGQTIMVPTVEEGAAALGTTGTTPSVAPAAETTETSAATAAGHVVQPGESLSAIAGARGVSVAELAAANARGTDSWVYAGETIQVPAGTGAVAPVSSGGSDTSGLGHVPSPYGDLHLEQSAADSWNAMRDESLRLYGQDIHPGGPLSAYRTYEQQAYLYDLYLRGEGAPANAPGTSSHETGRAVDVETPEMSWVIDQIGHPYGWGRFEAPGEWWHFTHGW